MKIQDLQKQIKTNDLQSLYIFTGEEIAIQNVYIDKIQEITERDIEYVDSFDGIKESVCSGLFNQNKIYIIISDTDIIKQEASWVFLEQSKSIIILKYASLDKRSKFYKHFANNIVDFEKLQSSILVQYIQNDINLSFKNCNMLIDLCDNDYSKILLEIDKLKNYNDERFKTYDERFDSLYRQGAYYNSAGYNIFEFVDYIVTRDKYSINNMLEKVKNNEENFIGLLTLIYNKLRVILLIQSCKSDNIEKTTGLAGNIIYYNKDKINYYSITELVNALQLLQDLDIKIKKGQIEDSIAFDYFLLNIL